MAREIQRKVTQEELDATEAMVKEMGGTTITAIYLGGPDKNLARTTVNHWLKHGPCHSWQVALGLLYPKLAPESWKIR